jgi:hypothetical protein
MLDGSYNMGSPLVGVVTNGSVEKKAITLAKMARVGLISARLSYDKFHNTALVTDRVRMAFDRKMGDYGPQKENEQDFREVNQWTYSVTPHGRALKNGLGNHPFVKDGDCVCDGLFITPDGVIWRKKVDNDG